MNPLETLLQPIARVLNRNIRESTRASELCERLDGKLIAIRVRDTALSAYFELSRDALYLSTNHDGEPDVVITGSLVALALMAGEDSIRDGSLDLTGDAATAQAFQQLLTHARPDIEEELSAVIGDTAAHGLGEFARAAGQWARQTRSIMGDNIREYLQEESRDVPSRYETEQFSKRVNELRDDVDRLAARIDRLAESPR
ncbi:MAG: SCP2 sterol-binding domain-containing protein [Gammaproteobacteria bacterium]|jgi:ubiquinone biosynthesis protein UbiJ|nr:SCP2 sterol-binding domain-containing protein [Gammaproteobacteria bacterium]MDH3848878.1 SCP2 sterol-binding domain-containing protein [Gammaproteobacteria bacterium]MDH3863421.1 SCP2 sterol-binding domain-containing protein [Gammaproteobacteria bacterium]MDH3906087.1 SCP2 sterol-binding domain-containing protein [Gammaproteobacteria bacterium]MDH3954443.1 SCP2 sterol-binding domain-containing protein [Gammaproteobacteria bacterium]